MLDLGRFDSQVWTCYICLVVVVSKQQELHVHAVLGSASNLLIDFFKFSFIALRKKDFP